MMAALALSGSAVVGGIAVASSTTPTVHACANAKGSLALLSAKGKCAKGFSKVTIAKTGPTGPKGAAGPRGNPGSPGMPGAPGPAGPGALSSVVTSTSTSALATGSSVVAGGTNLQVQSRCQAGTVAEVTFAGLGDYLVHGATEFVANGGVAASYVFNTSSSSTSSLPISTGPGVLDFENNSPAASTTADIEADFASSGTGKLSTDVVVSDGTVTFTVDVFLEVDGSSCNATAQVTPTV
jgi:hypothetical protein